MATASSDDGVLLEWCRNRIAEPTTDDETEEGVVAYPPGESKATFELYEDKGGEYRWRRRRRNGNSLLDGSQGHSSGTKTYQEIDGVKRDAPNAETNEG